MSARDRDRCSTTRHSGSVQLCVCVFSRGFQTFLLRFTHTGAAAATALSVFLYVKVAIFIKTQQYSQAEQNGCRSHNPKDAICMFLVFPCALWNAHL